MITGARRLFAVVVVIAPFRLAPQSPQSTPPASRPPISAPRALVSSMLIPGLAQARLDRGTGLLFATTEAIALAMYAKASHEYKLAQTLGRDSTPVAWTVDPQTGRVIVDPVTGAPQVAEWSKTRYERGRMRARKTHVEDWVAVLIFNHLFAGIDGFVAAQLWDLPANVEFSTTPRGTRLTARFRW